MFQRFNVQAREAMERAASKARDLGHAYVEPEHLLSGLTDDGEASFHGMLSPSVMSELTNIALPPARAPGVASRDPVFSPHARRVLAYTVEEADRLGHKRVGTSHLLLGLLRDATSGPSGIQTLKELGLDLDAARTRAREISEDEGSSTRDVVPAILFFELDRRARDAEADLASRLDRMQSENETLRGMVQLLGDRLARLEANLGHIGRRAP
jgi:ATP-dependent Clp protease ATP-binding subunit ClpC